MNKILPNCVVLFEQGPGGGILPDFLEQLSPEKRRQYIYFPFYATTSDETWVYGLKLKLQQLCKKNCKKPIVVSALFNTELEMLLSSIQQYAIEWYLTSSTGEVKISLANQETLPLPNSNYLRSNIFYSCSSGYCDVNKVYGHEIINRNYRNSLLSNVARGGQLIEMLNDVARIDSKTLIADLTSFSPEVIWNLAVPEEDLDSSPSLSDHAVQQVALGYDNSIVIQQLENSNYVVLEDSGERKYLKLFGRPNLTAPENLNAILDLAGMTEFFLPNGTMNFSVNLASSTGKAFDACAEVCGEIDFTR
jgi:hypothetical protein